MERVGRNSFFRFRSRFLSAELLQAGYSEEHRGQLSAAAAGAARASQLGTFSAAR